VSRRIHVDFRKWPDTVHWQFDMFWLGEDEWGTWLWSPPGSFAQRGNEKPKVFPHTNVKLIRPDVWWTAIWNDQARFDLYVDIIMPPVWDEDRVTMIDLDLDIERSREGTVTIVDEDEFAEHQIQLDYPKHLIDGARVAADDIARQVAEKREPFVATGARWMDLALSKR
jgi:hypothetical protein